MKESLMIKLKLWAGRSWSEWEKKSKTVITGQTILGLQPVRVEVTQPGHRDILTNSKKVNRVYHDMHTFDIGAHILILKHWSCCWQQQIIHTLWTIITLWPFTQLTACDAKKSCFSPRQNELIAKVLHINTRLLYSASELLGILVIA